MLAVGLLLTLVVCRLLWLPSSSPESGQPAVIHATVRLVLDGDTFDCADGRRVRLLGVDAPELAHGADQAERFAEQSTAWLRQRLEGRHVQLQLEQRTHDRYGRTLAWVYDGRQLINRELLSSGAARLLPDFGLPDHLEPSLRAAEAEARVARRGLWQKR